ISLGIFKLNPGIDFTSGSRVDILSDDSLTTEEVESDFDSLNLDTKAIVLNGENNESAVTRFDSVLLEDKITEVKNKFKYKYRKESRVCVSLNIFCGNVGRN